MPRAYRAGFIAAVSLALLSPLLAACGDQTATCKKGTECATGDQGTAPQKPSCDEVGGSRGVQGVVVGSEWVEGGPHDGLTCLEIKRTDGTTRLIRVPQAVFDRCLEEYLYPKCAQDQPASR